MECKKQKRACIYNERESHIGTDFALFRFFFTEKPVTCAVVPPLLQKGTLASPVRL
jgi:hypothetical protein